MNVEACDVVIAGFTQKQVGIAMVGLYGKYGQRTISRFENLDLSLKTMRELNPRLQRWLEEES